MSRLGAYGIILFFICINVSLYMLNEFQVVGDFEQPPYETPTGIQDMLLNVDLSGENLLMGGTIIAVGIIFGFITGHLVYGGTIALILFALDLLLPVVRWVLFGFPVFLTQIGVDAVIVTSLNVLMAVVWFWFFLGFVGQRQLEKF